MAVPPSADHATISSAITTAPQQAKKFASMVGMDLIVIKQHVAQVAINSTATAKSQTLVSVGRVGLVLDAMNASLTLVAKTVTVSRHGSVFVNVIGVAYYVIKTSTFAARMNHAKITELAKILRLEDINATAKKDLQVLTAILIWKNLITLEHSTN